MKVIKHKRKIKSFYYNNYENKRFYYKVQTLFNNKFNNYKEDKIFNKIIKFNNY